MASGGSQGIVVSIQAKIEGWQEQIKQIQSALQNIKVGTGMEKGLRQQLAQVESLVNNLGKNVNQRLTSNSQITALTDKVRAVDTIFEHMGVSLQKVSFDNLNPEYLTKNFSELLTAIEAAETAMTSGFQNSFQGAIAESAKMQKAFDALKINPENMNLEEIRTALSEGLKGLIKDIEKANKKTDDLRNSLNQVKAQQKELESSKIMQMTSTKTEARQIVGDLSPQQFNKTEFNIGALQSIGENIAAKLEGANEKVQKKREEIQSAIKNLLDSTTIEEAKQNLEQLETIFEKLGSKQTFNFTKTDVKGYIDQLSNVSIDENAIIAKRDEIIAALSSYNVKDSMMEGLSKDITKFLNNGQLDKIPERVERVLADTQAVAAAKIPGITATINELTKQLHAAQSDEMKLGAQRYNVNAGQQELENVILARVQAEVEPLRREIENLKQQLNEKATSGIKETGGSISRMSRRALDESTQAAKAYEAQLSRVKSAEQMLGKIQGVVQRWFSIYAAVRMVGQAVRSVISTIKELDKTITEIAIVTDMSQSELWDQMPQYTAMAREYAASISGVYQVSQLYYQQGLQTADVMALTEQTLKMARISGLDYAQATDYMTNAVRSFKMEMTEAQTVVDVYSAIAAKSATSVTELASAMSKTASSAQAVGSSFENTTAMMAVMIEATRESAENIGSAMKSIISRYGEMTSDPSKLVDSEGEEMSLNRVDKALQTVGISIHTAEGQFRDFDEVIMELAEKWNTIDTNTQRYIATIMAGNRQQSRFLALVSSYDRLKELSAEAADSENASQLQYLKTLDSIEAKTQQLQTSIQALYVNSGLEGVYKNLLDFANRVVTTLDNLSDTQGLAAVVTKIATMFTTLALVVSNAFLLMKTKASIIQAQITANTQYESARRALIEKAGLDTVISYEQGHNRARRRLEKEYTNEYNNYVEARTKKELTSQQKIMASNKKMIGGMMASMAGMALSTFSAQMDINTQRQAKAITSGLGSALSGIGTGLMIGGSSGILMGALSMLPGIIEAIGIWSENTSEKVARLQSEIDKTNNDRLKAENELKTLSDYKKKYNELSSTRYIDTEHEKEWIDLNNEIVSNYPELLSYIDAEGNAIANLGNAYDTLLDSKKDAYKTVLSDNIVANVEAFNDMQNVLSNYITAITKSVSTDTLWAPGGIKTIIGSTDARTADVVNTWLNKFSELATQANGSLDQFKTLVQEELGVSLSSVISNKVSYREMGSILESALGVLGNIDDEAAKKIADFVKNLVDNFEDYVTRADKYMKGQIPQMIEVFGTGLDFSTYSFKKNDISKELFKKWQEALEEASGNPQIAATKFVNNIEEWLNNWNTEFINNNYSKEKLSRNEDIFVNRDKYSTDFFLSENLLGEADLLSTEQIAELRQEATNKLRKVQENNLQYLGEAVQDGIIIPKEDRIDNLQMAVRRFNYLLRSIPQQYLDNYSEQLKNILQSRNYLQDDKILIIESIKEILSQVKVLDISDENKNKIYSILNTVDYTSLSSIIEIEEQLSKIGISLDFSMLKDKIIPNLEIEFANLTKNTSDKLTELDKALSNLSKGLDLKSTIEMIDKLGLSIKDFDIKEGKYFYNGDINQIKKGYLDTSEQLIQKLDEKYFKLVDRENGILYRTYSSKIDDTEGYNVLEDMAFQKKEYGITDDNRLINEAVRAFNIDESTAAIYVKYLNQYYQAWIDQLNSEDAIDNIVDFIAAQLKESHDSFTQFYKEYADYQLNSFLITNNRIQDFINNLLGEGVSVSINDLFRLVQGQISTDDLGLSAEQVEVLSQYIPLLSKTYKDINKTVFDGLVDGLQDSSKIIDVSNVPKEIIDDLLANKIVETISDTAIRVIGDASSVAAKIMSSNLSADEKNEYINKIMSSVRSIPKNIFEEINEIAKSKKDDLINISYLQDTFGNAVKVLLESYGLVVEDGFARITDNTNIPGLVSALISKADQKNILLESEFTTLQDTLLDLVQEITDIIKKGIEGQLSYSDAATLKDWATTHNLEGELDFTETADGLKLTFNSALKIYNVLKDIDDLQAQKVFDDLNKSLQETNEHYKGISDILNRIKELDAMVPDARSEEYEKELALAKEILAVRSTSEDSSFNFMSNKVPGGQNNPLNYYKNWSKAWKTLNDSFSAENQGSYIKKVNGVAETIESGFIDYEDWYNIVNEMNNIAKLGGEIKVAGVKLNGSLKAAAELINKGAQSLVATDTGDIKVALSGMELDFVNGTADFSDGVENGIQALATSQIEMLDGMINFLETVVKMKDLEKISDGDNKIDLTDLFPEFKFNTEQSTLNDEARKILSSWLEDKNFKEILETISINNESMASWIEQVTTQGREISRESAEQWTAYINSLYQMYLSGNYSLDNVFESIKQVASESKFHGSIKLGDIELTFTAGEIITKDQEGYIWNNERYASAEEALVAIQKKEFEKWEEAANNNKVRNIIVDNDNKTITINDTTLSIETENNDRKGQLKDDSGNYYNSIDDYFSKKAEEAGITGDNAVEIYKIQKGIIIVPELKVDELETLMPEIRQKLKEAGVTSYKQLQDIANSWTGETAQFAFKYGITLESVTSNSDVDQDFENKFNSLLNATGEESLFVGLNVHIDESTSDATATKLANAIGNKEEVTIPISLKPSETSMQEIENSLSTSKDLVEQGQKNAEELSKNATTIQEQATVIQEVGAKVEESANTLVGAADTTITEAAEEVHEAANAVSSVAETANAAIVESKANAVENIQDISNAAGEANTTTASAITKSLNELVVAGKVAELQSLISNSLAQVSAKQAEASALEAKAKVFEAQAEVKEANGYVEDAARLKEQAQQMRAEASIAKSEAVIETLKAEGYALLANAASSNAEGNAEAAAEARAGAESYLSSALEAENAAKEASSNATVSAAEALEKAEQAEASVQAIAANAESAAASIIESRDEAFASQLSLIQSENTAIKESGDAAATTIQALINQLLILQHGKTETVIGQIAGEDWSVPAEQYSDEWFRRKFLMARYDQNEAGASEAEKAYARKLENQIVSEYIVQRLMAGKWPQQIYGNNGIFSQWAKDAGVTYFGRADSTSKDFNPVSYSDEIDFTGTDINATETIRKIIGQYKELINLSIPTVTYASGDSRLSDANEVIKGANTTLQEAFNTYKDIIDSISNHSTAWTPKELNDMTNAAKQAQQDLNKAQQKVDYLSKFKEDILDGVINYFTGLGFMPSNQNEVFTSIITRMNAFLTDGSSLDDLLADVNSIIEEAKPTIEVEEQDFAALKQQNQEKIKNRQDEIDRQEDEYNAKQQRISQLEEELKSRNPTADASDSATQTELQSQYAILEAELNQLKAQLKDDAARIEELKKEQASFKVSEDEAVTVEEQQKLQTTLNNTPPISSSEVATPELDFSEYDDAAKKANTTIAKAHYKALLKVYTKDIAHSGGLDEDFVTNLIDDFIEDYFEQYDDIKEISLDAMKTAFYKHVESSWEPEYPDGFESAVTHKIDRQAWNQSENIYENRDMNIASAVDLLNEAKSTYNDIGNWNAIIEQGKVNLDDLRAAFVIYCKTLQEEIPDDMQLVDEMLQDFITEHSEEYIKVTLVEDEELEDELNKEASVDTEHAEESLKQLTATAEETEEQLDATGSMTVAPTSSSKGLDTLRNGLNNLKGLINKINDSTIKPQTSSFKLANIGITGAKGNVSFAKGTLMGELGPELYVTNGHYFIAGQNGAEFVNLPDDAIVFNHLQTKKLLGSGSSSRGKAVTSEKKATSYATGNAKGPAMASAESALATLKQIRSMWQSMLNASLKDLGQQAGGGGGGGGDKKKNALDPGFIADLERWYNLLRQINKLEKDINHEETLRNKLQNDRVANGAAIYKSQKRQLGQINDELVAHYQLATLQKQYYDKRREDLNQSQYGKLFTFNEDGIMQYNDQAVVGQGTQYETKGGLNALATLYARNADGSTVLSAKEQYERLLAWGFGEDLIYDASGNKIDFGEDEEDEEKRKETEEAAYKTAVEAFENKADAYMEEMDSLYDSYREQQDAILQNDIKRNEILQAIKDNQLAVEERVLSAIVEMRQQQIDNAQKERDALEKNSQKFIDGLSKTLSKERQMYENEKNEEELNKMRRQLGILQRSGGATSAIRNLQDQISSKEKDLYFDKQQQQIDAIQEASNIEIERLDAQIELMTETLEYQKENGLLWNQVYSVMQNTPEVIMDFITKNNKEFAGKSAAAQQEFTLELKKIVDQWNEYRTDSDAYWTTATGISQHVQTAVDGLDQNDWHTYDKAMTELFGEGLWGKYREKAETFFTDILAQVGDPTKAMEDIKATPEYQELLSQYEEEKAKNAANQKPIKTSEESTSGKQTGSGGGSGGAGGSSTTKKEDWREVNGGKWEKYINGKGTGEYTYDNPYDLKPKVQYKEYKVRYHLSTVPNESFNSKEEAEARKTKHIDDLKKQLEKLSYSPVQQEPIEAELWKWRHAKITPYDKGGLIDYTGLAMVHGSKIRPESVYDAETTAEMKDFFAEGGLYKQSLDQLHDTILNASILQMDNGSDYLYNIVNTVDVIRSIMSNKGEESNNQPITIQKAEVNLNVPTISSDYDARRAGAMVMDEMVKIARKNGIQNNIGR